MSAARVLSEIDEPEKVQKLFLVMNDWSQVELRTSDNTAMSAQSFSGNQKELRLRFNGETPSSGDASITFDIGGTVYYLKGRLKSTALESEFKPTEFYKEQRRKVIRMNIPESYPAELTVQVISSEKMMLYARINDISSGGCRLIFPDSPELKIGTQVEGLINLGSHPEIKVAARVRYVEKVKGQQIAGVEFRHLEYGSEEKINDVINKLKREIA